MDKFFPKTDGERIEAPDWLLRVNKYWENNSGPKKTDYDILMDDGMDKFIPLVHQGLTELLSSSVVTKLPNQSL